MKKILRIFCITNIIFALAGCTPRFNGNRTGNDSQFIMDYSAFNMTDSQDLVLKAGDSINTKIVVDGGSVSIVIQQGEKEPVYQGDDITSSSEFDVKVEEGGTYRVSVTGKKAKGSVSFIVKPSEK